MSSKGDSIRVQGAMTLICNNRRPCKPDSLLYVAALTARPVAAIVTHSANGKVSVVDTVLRVCLGKSGPIRGSTAARCTSISTTAGLLPPGHLGVTEML